MSEIKKYVDEENKAMDVGSATEKMTNMWISKGNSSHRTIIELRNALKFYYRKSEQLQCQNENLNIMVKERDVDLGTVKKSYLLIENKMDIMKSVLEL